MGVGRVVRGAGPEYWGLVNPDWFLCSRGLHQSPVDVDPRRMLYDPHLSPFRIERQKVYPKAIVDSRLHPRCRILTNSTKR